MSNGLFHISNPIFHPSINATAVDPYLPDDDPLPDARAAKLAQAKKDYQYDWETENAPGVPLLKKVPVREFFSQRYIIEVAAAFGRIKLNNALPPIYLDAARALRTSDYADLYVILDKPAVIEKNLWATDESFGEQRLSGANPVRIECVRSKNVIKELLSPSVERAFGASDAAQEIAAGRLFVVDHRPPLRAITKGTTVKVGGKTFKKSLPKTAALFWWNRWTERLMPISILVEEQPPKLFTPQGNADGWVRAKIAFQACDGVVHEMSTHLGRTHLVMEAVGIAFKRNLADTHPIHRLLLPHFRFMMSQNQLAERTLIAPGSEVAVSFGAPLKQVVGVAGQAFATWDFTDHAFENDIQRRGVGTSTLPIYAYRDDAQLLWRAISEYVAEYVGLYYSNDASVAADPELAAWSKEVSKKGPSGAGIRGFPSLTDVDGLVFALSQIIFTCSAQHSAVNYPQDNYLSFVPNSPFGLWAPLGTKNLLNLLPPMGPAEGQIGMLAQLTAFRYDKLGDYAGKYTRDERANQVTRKFFGGLAKVDAAIAQHQANRWQSYEYLRPPNVLNSISI